MRNCPNCGTPMMKGWCPNCHPNPQQVGVYKAWLVSKVIGSVVFIVVVLAIFAFFAFH